MDKKNLQEWQKIELSLTKDFRAAIWSKFTKAVKTYRLIEPDDRICCCISGGKDSMLMALLLLHLRKYSDFPFSVRFLVMDPGYSKPNLELIKANIVKLHIPATIVSTDIFAIANAQSKSPCYLCAKMRRGALYRIAKELGCNKIALGHHYDDVIETTLMNMLNSGSFQTMLPKLPSTHYEGMEIIRPMYLIREKAVIEFADFHGLRFLRCACSFTERTANDQDSLTSMRAKTKALIAELAETYNPLVEKNIFKAASNVQLEKIVGYHVGKKEFSFLDNYEDYRERTFASIEEEGLEEAAIEKAIREHRAFVFDESLNYEADD